MEHSLWHLDGQWFVISTDRPQVSVVRFFGQATSNVTSILTFPELVEGKMTSLKSRVKTVVSLRCSGIYIYIYIMFKIWCLIYFLHQWSLAQCFSNNSGEAQGDRGNLRPHCVQILRWWWWCRWRRRRWWWRGSPRWAVGTVGHSDGWNSHCVRGFELYRQFPVFEERPWARPTNWAQRPASS